MQIHQNYPLSNLTTFHIGGPADYFVSVESVDELKEALKYAQEKKLPVLVLGGGSNVLVSDKGFDGLVIKIAIKGIEIVEQTEHDVIIKSGAGEIWDDVVLFAVNHDFWGIENLSHVPGQTGAVPVQNVGCYGQEASQVILRAEVFNIEKNLIEIWSKQDFQFSYRSSRLNQDLKNQFVVISVFFRLSKIAKPNLSYVDLRKYFESQTDVSLQKIRQALQKIRGNKFPKISELGSDGSFFKNLILDSNQIQTLDENIKKNFSGEVVEKYEQIKHKFPMKEGVKIPSAFLIDICGLKGKTVGGAKLWEKQPLVIVNTGMAKASDVLDLFMLIKQEVLAKTGMELEPEPEFIGF